MVFFIILRDTELTFSMKGSGTAAQRLCFTLLLASLQAASTLLSLPSSLPLSLPFFPLSFFSSSLPPFLPRFHFSLHSILFFQKKKKISRIFLLWENPSKCYNCRESWCFRLTLECHIMFVCLTLGLWIVSQFAKVVGNFGSKALLEKVQNDKTIPEKLLGRVD